MADTLANTEGRTREWIGPRIIPVFADEVQWDEDSNYEPLMMVQNQGETFMSRQYVPAGAPLPNTESGQESTDYWVHMSNWNAQVEGYREEVMRYAQEVLLFDGRIDSLEDALPSSDFDSTNTVSAKFEDVEDAIDDIEDVLPMSAFDSTNTVDARFDAIESNSWVTTTKIADDAVTTAKIADSNITTGKIANNAVTKEKIANDVLSTAKKYAGTNLVIFGDSFSQPGIENSEDELWCKQVSSTLGTTRFNYAIAGAGFGRTASLIQTQVANAITQMTQAQKENTSLIIMYAGANDLYNDVSTTDFMAGFKASMDTCMSNYPNATVLVIPFNFGCCYLTNAYIHKIDAIMPSIYQYIGAYKYRCSVLENAPYWLLGKTNKFRNEVHPNAPGYRIIAGIILNKILHGGNADGIDSGRIPASVGSGYIDWYFRNGIVTLDVAWNNASDLTDYSAIFASSIPYLTQPEQGQMITLCSADPTASSTSQMGPSGFIYISPNGAVAIRIKTSKANSDHFGSTSYPATVNKAWA